MRKLLLSVCFICMFIPSIYGQAKPRIAVIDNFEYAAGRAALGTLFGTDDNIGKGTADLLIRKLVNGNTLFGTDDNIGKGITDLLIHKLVNGNTFSVIERKYIDAILKEQDRSNSDRFDSSSAALIGRLIGVDAIVIGSITQFGRDDGNFAVGIPCLPGVPAYLCGKGGGQKKAKAVVGITARIVNVHTGEIVVSVAAKGESKRSAIDIFGGGGPILNIGSSNFGETIIGEAVNAAVDSIVSQLQANSYKVTAHPVRIDGLVAHVDGNELTLNIGSKAGVEVGDILVVIGRTTLEVRDPVTGAVIRRVVEQIGDVEITEVEALSSVGEYIGSPVKAGDRVVRN